MVLEPGFGLIGAFLRVVDGGVGRGQVYYSQVVKGFVEG